MNIALRVFVFLAASCLITSCQYLNPPPTCSDDSTLDLVREIIGEAALDGSPLPTNEVLRKRLTFNYPHATKLEENIQKYSCEAHLIVHGESQTHEVLLSYESQVTDSGNHLVQASGLNVLDAAAIKAALSLPEPKAIEPPQQQAAVESTPSVEPAETPAATPELSGAHYSPLLKPDGRTVFGGECFRGSCPWYKILAVEKVKDSDSELTLKVTLSNGSSEDPEDFSKPPSDTEWSPPSIYNIRCSHTLPSVSEPSPGRDELLPLRLGTAEIGAANVDLVNLYFAICHSSSDVDVNNNITKFKYDVTW